MPIENCTECEKHLVIADPDPTDWFCDDDTAVVCTLTPNPKKDLKSRHRANHSDFRAITVACRPYNIKKESDVPSWCPLV